MRHKTDALTAKEEQAAALVALDEESDKDIAARVGIGRATLDRWKQRPEFEARVQAIVAELARSLQRYHIARKDKRMAEYDARRHALIQVRQERAQDATLNSIPGASTGLIVKTLKVIGAGKDAQTVEEYSVDTGYLSSILSLEKQASQEAGQWADKTDVTTNGESLPGATVQVFHLPAKSAAPNPETE